MLIKQKLNNYPIPAGAVFVSPNGANTGTGNDKTKPVSLARGRALAVSGVAKVLVLQGGTYNVPEGFAIGVKGLVIQAAPNEFPVLSGFRKLDGFKLENGKYTLAYDITLPPVGGDARMTRPDNPSVANGHNIFVGDKMLKQNASLANLKSGEFYVDLKAKKLYLFDKPVAEVNAIEGEKGLSLNGAVTAKGIGIMGYANGVGMGDGSQLIDCVVSRISYDGFAGQRNFTLRGCEVSYIGKKCGGGGWFGGNILLEDNDFHHANQSDFNRSWDVSVLKMQSGRPELKVTNKLVVRGNRVYDSNCTGIWYDNYTYEAVIEDNECYNLAIALMDEISTRNIYRNNYIHDCNTGILFSCTKQATAINNTIENCGRGIWVGDWGRDIGTDTEWRAEGNVVKNNLVIAGERTGSFTFSDTYKTESSTQYVKEMSNNLYVKSGAKPTNYTRWCSSPTKQDKNYTDLKSFIADNPGYEKGSAIVDVLPSPLPTNVGSTLTRTTTEQTTEEDPEMIAELQTQLDSLNIQVKDLSDERDRLLKDTTSLSLQVQNLTNENTSLKSSAATTEAAMLADLTDIQKVVTDKVKKYS